MVEKCLKLENVLVGKSLGWKISEVGKSPGWKVSEVGKCLRLV